MKPTGRVRGRANIGWNIVQLGRIASPSVSRAARYPTSKAVVTTTISSTTRAAVISHVSPMPVRAAQAAMMVGTRIETLKRRLHRREGWRLWWCS